MDLRPASRQDFTRRYGVAVLAALAALLLQSLLQPILGDRIPITQHGWDLRFLRGIAESVPPF